MTDHKHYDPIQKNDFDSKSFKFLCYLILKVFEYSITVNTEILTS
jgi:hypothetical protein